MKTSVKFGVLLCCVLGGGSAVAADDSASRGQVIGGELVGNPRIGGNVSLNELLESVAKKSGKTFIVDPRAPAQVSVIGKPAASIGYGDVAPILAVVGMVMVEDGSVVKILPDANARMVATPVLLGKDSAPDDKIVTSIIHMKHGSAAQLVPILRPLLPQWGHLAADTSSNDLLIVDNAANVKRIAAIVQALDVEPVKAEH
jgi:general secretion pathway protein D